MLTKISKTQITIIIISLIIVISGIIFAILQSNKNKNQDNNLQNSTQNLSSSSTNFSQRNQQETNSSLSNSIFSSSIPSNQNSVSLLVNSVNNSLNNQLKPLVADNKNDVVVLKDCDLAIKYPKDSDYKVNLSNNFELGEYMVKNFFRIAKPESDQFKITIACDSKNFLQKEIEKITKETTHTKPTSEKLCKDLKMSIQVCTQFKPLLATNYLGLLDSYSYYFERNGIYYSIETFSTDIQIQPNSLAPSTPSVNF